MPLPCRVRSFVRSFAFVRSFVQLILTYIHFISSFPFHALIMCTISRSHYTAFPCADCKDCGHHTDPYFDPTKSSTSTIPQCGGQKCLLSQSYSEGSSWKAYKVFLDFHFIPTSFPLYIHFIYSHCIIFTSFLF